MRRFRPDLPLMLVLASMPFAATASAGPDADAPAAPTSPTSSASPAAPAVSVDVASYDIGLMVGTQLANNGLGPTISREALMRGIKEALGGRIVSSGQKVAAQQFINTERTAFAKRNTELAHAFFEKNAHASGIKTLPSGIQYRVLAAGDTKAPPPKPRDEVTVRYRASLADGTEIDRSDDHPQPATFRLNSVLQGWRDALSAMSPGAKWQIFVPPELGYGANSPPPIPPGALMVYELELLKVEAPKPLSPEMKGPPRPASEVPAQGTVQSPSGSNLTPEGSANLTK